MIGSLRETVFLVCLASCFEEELIYFYCRVKVLSSVGDLNTKQNKLPRLEEKAPLQNILFLYTIVNLQILFLMILVNVRFLILLLLLLI